VGFAVTAEAECSRTAGGDAAMNGLLRAQLYAGAKIEVKVVRHNFDNSFSSC
jgi:hypothetical protein